MNSWLAVILIFLMFSMALVMYDDMMQRRKLLRMRETYRRIKERRKFH